ncbi:inositol monophosphatase family protein [Tritonibacter scottomollicae]|uniref:inositol monophosphatase family protein n=1 Tax=Tritonibacter scottomollicae TaxID=483013 RepID=UPI003BABCCF5
MRLDQDIEEALITMVRAAARAEIMPRFRNLSAGAITAKSSAIDLVTVADVAAEAHMTRAVAEILPGAVVIGEEAVSKDASVLARLPDAEVAVILDPIDGTWNFANGLAVFGVILSVVVRGQTVFGLLYDPVMDDWVQASLGGGAWFAAPDRTPERLQVAPERPFAEATGFLPHYVFPQDEQPRLAQGMIRARRVNSLFCSCHEYRMMAQGNADFVQNESLNCWDHAAGVLAVLEAGGHAQLVDGRDYAPAISEGRLTVSTGARMRNEVIQAFGLG